MEYRGIKINIVIYIIIVVLIVYFSGNFIINKYNVQKPLLTEIESLENIENVQLLENNDRTKLKIKLNRNAELYDVYLNVKEIATEKIGEDNFNIIIDNQENDNLVNIYFKAHYAIFEGIATNKFTEMNEDIKEIAVKSDLKEYKLWIDSNNLYLKLADEDSAFYHIIPRNSNNRGGENVG